MATSLKRVDGRAWNELRSVHIAPGYLAFAEGSALIDLGLTRVLCAVSVEDGVPTFLRGSGRGWVTAEYSMLPRSTLTRTTRESTQGKVGGRTQEIQRLIGRSLRAIIDMRLLGERTFQVDCDVLQADGGTRTAAITGAYVALYQAIRSVNKLKGQALTPGPLKCAVGATSVGIVKGTPLLDLCYREDSQADVDFNVVMTSAGEFVEVQGTAEGEPFSRATIDQVLELAQQGIQQLFTAQQDAIEKLS